MKAKGVGELTLPTKAQLVALGDAVMQARAAMGNALRGLESLEGKDENEQAMLALVRRDLAAALEPWESL